MICTPFCSLCRKAKLSRISSRLNVSRKFLKSVSIRTNFTWNDSLEKYVENLVTEYDRIDKKLLNSQALSPTQVKRYSREIHRLKPAVQSYDDLKRKQNEMMEMIELGEVDVDMKNLVDEEVELYQCRISELQSKLINLVIPKDEEDTSNAILELRAGAGGREAAIFASEMFNMYSKFCVLKNWKLEVLSQNESNEGGLSKACASIIGRNVFGTLKHEIGVHRVQRVPLTESLGRLHTSTVAVAVLPQPTDINVVLDMRDVKVDTFKSSGAGGQHVNTTDSAVRLTHIPTGIVVASQEERSQIKNKSNAIRILTARLYDLERNRADKEMHEARRSQIGTADRSERVRTYNFPQDRVTDHRIGVSFHGINEFLVGGSPLMDLIEKLQLHEKMKSLSRISGENLINAASNN